MDFRESMRSDAVSLRSEIQAFIETRGLSVLEFARMADLAPATVQNIKRSDWAPSFSVLQACTAAVHAKTSDNGVSFHPLEFALPPQYLDRTCNVKFKACIEIWRSHNALASSELLKNIEASDPEIRVNMVEAGHDNRLWFKKIGLAAFGHIKPEKRQLAGLPDRQFGLWVEERIWAMLAKGEPTFASCEVWMDTIYGAYDVPYTILRLPLRQSIESPWYDAAMTITRLEDSAYRRTIIAAPHTRASYAARARSRTKLGPA